MTMNYPNREPTTRDSTPYLLTTGPTPLAITVSAATLLPGPPVLLPTVDLINTLRTPVEVTELHFVTVGFQSMAFELSLAMGQHQITRDFVPLSAIDVRRDSIPVEGVGPSGPKLPSNQKRWILPRPLIMGPNEGFSGMVRLSSTLAPFPAFAPPDQVNTFTMVARGRRLPSRTPIPSRREIPFASGWIFDQPNTPAPDLVFSNTFGVPLHVSSINLAETDWGRLSTGTITINAPGGLANTVLRGMVAASIVSPIFTERSAIEEAHVLEPGEMYLISLSHPVSTAPASYTAVNIIGWREE